MLIMLAKFIICLVDEDDVIQRSSRLKIRRLKIYSTGCFKTRRENKKRELKNMILMMELKTDDVEDIKDYRTILVVLSNVSAVSVKRE